MNLIENKERIFSQVAKAMETANRRDQVNVIAVTKYVGIDQAKALADTGVCHIGNQDQGCEEQGGSTVQRSHG